MVLAEALEGALAGVEGARGLWLVGLDGIIVAGAGDEPELPGEFLAASYADILRRVSATGSEAEFAPPSELTVHGPSGTVIVRPLDDELTLLAVVRPDAIAGKARHQLRLAAERVKSRLLA